MNNEIIHISICFDKEFLRYALILIESTIAHNKMSKIHFHFVIDNVSVDEFNIIETLINESGNEMSRYFVSESVINLFDENVLKKYALSFFHRFLIIHLIDSSIDKILYLDSDILVNGDLRELWNTDISNHAFAGVLDTFYLDYELDKIREFFGGNVSKYFNTGVMLLNTDYWRNIDNLKEYISVVNRISNKTTLMDQDALNILLRDKVLILPPKFNFFNGIGDFPLYYYAHHYSKKELKDAFRSPVIVHFSYRRPDQNNCFHHSRNVFWSYLKFSQFKSYFNKLSLSERIKVFVFSFGNPKERGWIMELESSNIHKFYRLYSIIFFNSKLFKLLIKVYHSIK